MRILLFLSLSLIMTSCSSRNWGELFGKETQSTERNEKLLKSFEVDNELLGKYAETQAAPEEKVETKKANEKKTDKKVKKTEPKKIIVAPVKTVTKPSKIKKKYPVDYPEEYIDLNEQTLSLWKELTPNIIQGEKIYIDINYMGISTGGIVVKTESDKQIAGTDVYHFNVKVKTSRFYSYLYQLDDNIDSYVSKDKFLPLKFSLIQRESGQDVDDLQLFDYDKLETYFFYKRVSKDKESKKNGTKFIPERFTDSLSVLFLMRSLPLAQNYKANIPVINKGKLLMMNVEVVGKEIINSEIGKIETYKVVAHTKYSGDTLKSGDMIFWFGTDEKRAFVKFEAKIKIGTISGNVAKYEID